MPSTKPTETGGNGFGHAGCRRHKEAPLFKGEWGVCASCNLHKKKKKTQRALDWTPQELEAQAAMGMNAVPVAAGRLACPKPRLPERRPPPKLTGYSAAKLQDAWFWYVEWGRRPSNHEWGGHSTQASEAEWVYRFTHLQTRQHVKARHREPRIALRSREAGSGACTTCFTSARLA
jgi:hypothetical protein